MKRLICVCSALLLSVGAAWGSDLTDFRQRVLAAESQEELQQVFDEAPESVKSDKSYEFYFDGSIDEALDRYRLDDDDWTDVQRWAAEDVDARLAKESGVVGGEIDEPGTVAGEILSNPIYIDREKREDRNWLGDTSRRLSLRFWDWFMSLSPDMSGPSSGFLLPSLGGIQFVMWAILILGVGIALFFILRNFVGIGRKKRVGGILEDDEPERTADQWLVQAEKLEKEGRLREAVRCLYLACLVRFDDGGIARFRRHETNWEHLYRIEASPNRPEGIDFRHLTQRFDKIWYGHKIDGLYDVQEFKEAYLQICKALGIMKAA